MDFFKRKTLSTTWRTFIKIQIGSILSISFDKFKKNLNLSIYTDLGHSLKTSLLFIGPLMRFYGL